MSRTPALPPLATVVTGAGPPVVALHGSGFSGQMFQRLRQAAEGRYTFVAVDLYGCGASPAAPAGATLQTEADALLALLSTFDEPVRVFGHSFGGLVAVEALMRAPERFAALVAYEPVIVVLAHREGSATAQAEVNAIADLMRISLDDGGHAWVRGFIDWWNGPGFFDRLPAAQKPAYVATAAASFRQASSVATSTVSPARLAGIGVPTLMLTGVTSPAAARESAALAAAALPRGHIEAIPGAGHMGPLTHSSVVNERVLRFFAEHAPPPR
jgi:pimeloyl-ACP methyl ester carboxylesterase